MSTLTWLEIPTRQFYIDSLIATQPHLVINALIDPEKYRYSLDPFPHVVIFGGQFYISDGHTRIAAAALNGKRYVLARALDLTGTYWDERLGIRLPLV